MRTALIALCALLMAPPGPVISAGPEPSSEDLSACQPVPRAPTQDAHRDAFLQRLDSVRCGEGAMRGALATPVASEQRGAGPESQVRLEVHAEASSDQEGPNAPQVRLSASAVDEGRAVEVSWDIQGEVSRCVAEGDHPLWSGIEAGASTPSGQWTHFPSKDEPTSFSLTLHCMGARPDTVAHARLRLRVESRSD